MFAEFGQAPLCLELDLDSYDGPWQHIARFRRGSGWLMVAKCTIQSEHDILTAKLVAACDEHEHAIPAFQATHLTECDWINPTYCDELPPDILDDLICEEEGALIARWHREKNSALAEAFDNQEARIAELEGRVQSIVARNEHQIGELRQRRRHPEATPDMRRAMGQIIRELDDENDELLAEMAETRQTIRDQADEFEEILWSREDLLIEVTPLHMVRWSAKPSRIPRRFKQPFGGSGTTSLAAIQRLSLSNLNRKLEERRKKREAEEADMKVALSVRRAENDQRIASKSAVRRRDLPKHSPAIRSLKPAPIKLTPAPIEEPAPDRVSEDCGWTYKRVELLKSMWRDGQSASTIAAALGNTSRNAVIGKAQRLGLPKSNTAVAMERIQPILAPVALRNLQMERDRARRSLSSLEMRGRKFFEGSKKFKRNREERAELEDTIAALDRKIEQAERRLEGNA